MDVDVLVLGWGKGGKTLAGALGRAGRRVAVVERSSAMYGGSCININCVPTKSLIHNATSRPHDADPTQWFAGAVDRRDALTGRLRERNHAMLDEIETVTLVQGHARFTGPHEVEVRDGDQRIVIEAPIIVVNTGSEPRMPGIAGADGPRVYDSTALQHVDPLPERLLVVGGGYVGLEFAGMFAHFGSRVTLIDRHDALLPHEDPDVAAAVTALLEEQGVEILLSTGVSALHDDGRVVATLATAGSATGSTSTRDADAVLLATGRRPTTDDLGLDAAGIKTDDRGFIVVDEQLRTSVPGVYAVGDVNGGPQFTYISLDDHRIVLDHLLGHGRRGTGDRVAVPSTTFLAPPLARVGLNERQACALGRTYRVASKAVADVAAMPRPKIVGRPQGLLKVLVDPDTDLILGATLLCVDAQEVINLIALAMRTGTTATQLRDGIWTHPSTTEGLNEVLADLRDPQDRTSADVTSESSDSRDE